MDNLEASKKVAGEQDAHDKGKKNDFTPEPPLQAYIPKCSCF